MTYSIIIPCYNSEKYLPETIGSVFEASKAVEDKIEVICVDDGSSDNTLSVLRSCEANAPANVSYKVIHKDNGGEGSARNAALSVATGDWLLYLDSDDILASWALETIDATISQNDIINLISYASTAFNDGDSISLDNQINKGGGATFMDLRSSIPDVLATIAVWQMVYRRSKFGHLRFGEYVIGADLVYTSACFSIADSMALLDTVCHAYRIRPNSMAHCQMSIRKMSDQVGYLQAMFENLYSSRKSLGLAFVRSRGNAWIEACGAELLRHRGVEWNAALTKWFDSLAKCSRMTFFSRWQRFVARACSVTRCSLVVLILCSIPNYLKLKGLHR